MSGNWWDSFTISTYMLVSVQATEEAQGTVKQGQRIIKTARCAAFQSGHVPRLSPMKTQFISVIAPSFSVPITS